MAEEKPDDELLNENDEQHEESEIEVEFSEAAAESLDDVDRTEMDVDERVRDAEGRALRAQAELENFRMRMRREADEMLKHANQPLMTDLLPVIDNFSRAVEAASNDEAASGLLQGVTMVGQQLVETLEKFHCKRIPAVGQPFDPNVHEAVQQMPSDEYDSGIVMLVVQEGYQLHARVIRPSQVIVSTGSASGNADGVTANAEESAAD